MSEVLSRDGTTIAFEQVGEGPPVILVDGAQCYRAVGPSRPLATALAGDFTVLAYDRRGRGDSGDRAPYAVEREVEDLAALIEHAGGSACVCGFSSGGALALEAAAAGLRITKVAVYEVPYGGADDASRQQAREYAARLGELLAADRRGDAVELFLMLMGMPREAIAEMRLAPIWPALEALAPTLAYDSAVLGHASTGGALPTERLSRVGVPTLVVAGGDSPAGLRDAAQRLVRALPDGRYRELPGETHVARAEALAPVLKDFFA